MQEQNLKRPDKIGGEIIMSIETHRITIVIPKELEEELKKIKKEKFYDCNRSVMLRELINKGLDNVVYNNEHNN